MLIRGDTFDKGECQPVSRKVTKLRGGIFIHEHFLSIASTHLHLAQHAEFITDRSKAHNILLGGGYVAAQTYTEDESVCSTATTETFDLRILWGISCSRQTGGVGGYHQSDRHSWLQSDGLTDQISMSILKPISLPLIATISEASVARLQLIVAVQIAKCLNDFLINRNLWSRERDCVVKVKWPNDLGITDSSGAWRKIGGILVEPLRTMEQDQNSYLAVDLANDLHRITNLCVAATTLDLYFVVSLGLNVNQCPPGLTEAGFLRQVIEAGDDEVSKSFSESSYDAEFECIGDSMCVCCAARINLDHLTDYLYGSLIENLNYRVLDHWSRNKHAFYGIGSEIDCVDEAGAVLTRGRLTAVDMMRGILRVSKKDGSSIEITPRTIKKVSSSTGRSK